MRIAIISKRKSPNTLDLIHAAKTRNITAKVHPLRELALEIEQLPEHEFFSYDAYIFRGYNKNYALAQALVQLLIARGKIVLDGVLAKNFIPSKLHEALVYKQNNIPHIPTYYAGSVSAWQASNVRLAFPVIVKDVDSQQGKGVRLCRNEAELLSEIEAKNTKIIIQQFINMQFDIRVICVGDKVIGAIKRESAGTDFRTNISQGGIAQAYTLSDEERSLAFRAHKSLGYDVSGVDITRDNDGNLCVIETNITPEWQGFKQATGIDVADIIIQHTMEK